MPFKIVLTHRKGRVELSTVPDSWENKGKLRWPKRSGELLAKDQNVRPQQDWSIFSCVVKRRHLLTYDEAEEELTKMMNETEVDETDGGERSRVHTSLQIKGYKRLAQTLVSSNNSSKFAKLSTPAIQANNEFQINGQVFEVIAEVPREDILEPSTSQGRHSSDDTTAQFNNIYDILVTVTQNQEKIMKRLGEITVRLDKMKQNRTFGITPSEGQGFYTKKVTMEPIDTLEDLKRLDDQLANPEFYSNLMEMYSILCSVVPGSGTNCAYRLLDALFTKQFLCLCSWTGGSRGVDAKIGFKHYKNVINFFFEMVRSWDTSYTMQNMEEFIKLILKNALKRRDSKNMRTSSKKRRRTFKARNADNESKENGNNEVELNSNSDDNTSHSITLNNISYSNNNDENEDLEDESLC